MRDRLQNGFWVSRQGWLAALIAAAPLLLGCSGEVIGPGLPDGAVASRDGGSGDSGCTGASCRDGGHADAGCVPAAEICGDGIDQDCNGSDLACPACAQGAVTSRCTCGGSTRTGGYCCTGTWQATSCSPSTQLFDSERVTTWNPGILVDAQRSLPLGADGLPQRTEVCATLNPGDNIQTAINNCAEGKVVQLNAGTFSVSSTVSLSKGVVLRGKGSQGAPTGTTLVKTGGGTALEIGSGRDQTCYNFGGSYALTADAAKESKTIAVGSAAAGNFAAGDVALVDQVDVSPVVRGDCNYFKRSSGGAAYRSISQRVEIASVDAAGGVLTLSAPLHWTFKAGGSTAAQIAKVSTPTVRWAGIESLRVQGGANTSYPGAMAGAIDISNAAYCWVKDVQTDNTIGGMHVTLTGTYRCVVRDSYIHHSANYGFGADCYGIVLRCGAAENLVENNIVRYMNKPILVDVTGGGNVIGYNYADNSWADNDWQEINIDEHCSFPHMELIEGNWAPHMGATTTHGNAGYLTFFRNFSSSHFASPEVADSSTPRANNLSALTLFGGDVMMNVVGNVFGEAGYSKVYEIYSGSSPASIYQLGTGGGGANDVVVTTLFRHGNFDYVHNDTVWDPSNAVRELPASLYYSAQPAWWPSATPWPWVGPDRTQMVGTLPAKSRADGM